MLRITLTGSRSEKSRVQTKIPSRKGGTISRRTAALSKRDVAQPHPEPASPVTNQPECSSSPVGGTNGTTDVAKQAEVVQSDVVIAEHSEAEVEQIVVKPFPLLLGMCTNVTNLDLRSLMRMARVPSPLISQLFWSKRPVAVLNNLPLRSP